MKFTFPKKFQTVYDFNKISVFFNWIVMLFQLTFVSWINCSCNVHLTKKLKSTWMLIGLPDFLCFKIFIFQSFKSVTPFVVQEWYPPTTVVHLQNANPRQLISLIYCCKLHWCRSTKRRTVFSQPEIGDQIWIQCRQYRQSTT